MEEHLFFLFLRILKNRGKLHADSTNIMGQEGFFPNLPVRTYPDIFYSGGLRRGIGDFNRDFYQQTQKLKLSVSTTTAAPIPVWLQNTEFPRPP